jgi:hypothetical protein
MSLPFGIDFGGTGIKGAPVDLASGDFAAERVRIRTPQPSTPDAVAEVFVELLGHFPEATGPVGVTVPGIVRHGVVHSAANIDDSWLGTDADRVFSEATGREVHVVNDADAAGLAEVQYGAAAGRPRVLAVPGHRPDRRVPLPRPAGGRVDASPPSGSRLRDHAFGNPIPVSTRRRTSSTYAVMSSRVHSWTMPVWVTNRTPSHR